jgi:hypothetical protein
MKGMPGLHLGLSCDVKEIHIVVAVTCGVALSGTTPTVLCCLPAHWRAAVPCCCGDCCCVTAAFRCCA